MTAQPVILRYRAMAPPSYANPGGKGNRTSLITIITNVTPGGGAITAMIDGSPANTLWFTNGQTSRWIVFDFGVGKSKVIDEFKWFQSGAQTHGTWRIQGSNNNSVWSDIGSDFTLGGALTQTFAFVNTTGWRYYRFQQISGAIVGTPYIQELEFKIADAS